MFEATAPFAFFDYFRVPYTLAGTGEGPQVPEGWAALWLAGQPDRALLWPAIDGPPFATAGAGRYRLNRSTIFGHVLGGPAVEELLGGLGSRWRSVAPILDGRGRAVASVRRDAGGSVLLPFDPGEVMWRYWSEGYRDVERSALAAGARAAALRAYYLARPLLPRAAQILLRQAFAKIQGAPSFPAWPVETSLHDLYDWLFDLVASFAGAPVPCIDVWPDGHTWALVLTHDVEAKGGYARMERLREVERAAGYRSSWNFVPLREPATERYEVGDDVLRGLADECCEVGVHGLRHDGRDLASLEGLRERLPAIRSYAERWGAQGFRSPATQRSWDWMPLLGFSYDSSFSDSDPYEPTPGGSCSLYPFFDEGMVELPITLPQDHTVFTILRHADAALWLNKAAHVRAAGGMALVLTHPDYADDANMVEGYGRLLETYREDPEAWRALPREVDEWWRARAASSLEETATGWVVKGPATGRGRVRLREPAGAEGGEVPADPAVAAAHVLVVVENVPAAIDTRLRKQIDSLLAAGHTLSIVTRRDPSNERYRGDARVRLYEYPSPPEVSGLAGYAMEYAASFLAASVLCVRALARDRVDVVQFCQPPDIYFPLAALLRAAGYAVLLDQRDLLPELFRARYGRADGRVLRVLRLLERLSYRGADRVVVVNDYLRERALEHGVDPARVTIVRNGPVLARVGDTRPDPALRRGHAFLCCWAGKMGRQDRLDILLGAIRSYVHDLGRTDCQFAILGDGECLEETKAAAREMGIDEWITFTDWVEEAEVFRYLATADLGLDSSLQEEVSPVKALEYMAHGLPLVAFDLRETRSIAEGAAAFAPPGDAGELASVVDDLLHHPPRRAALGRAGRERVRDGLGWERQARGYLEVVLDLTRRRRARRVRSRS